MELASLRNVFELCSAHRAAWRSVAFLERRRNSSASATSGALARSIVTRWFLDRCHDAATDDLNSEESAPRSTNFSHAARTSRWSIPAPPTCRWPQLRSLTIEHPLRMSSRGARRHQAKCNVRLAQTEDQDKSENVSGACIVMTGGVGPTKQSIQRSFPGFSSDFPTPPTHKLILVVRLRKAEPGRVSASAAIKRVIIGRAHDPIFTSSRPPPIRRESPSHRCPATIADGEGAAQHAGLQRRSFVPRRPS